jgi:hypothetical protein
LGLAVTSDPKIIFIILIITLNLHDTVSLAAIPEPIALDVGLAARSCHKSVILNKLIKNKKTNRKKKN